MSTSVAVLSGNVSPVANWQAWLQTVHNTFINFGWVQTADPQADLYGSYPGVNTYDGSLTYGMADSLQSACPCYCQLTFGGGQSTIGAPALKVQVATSTDGAGNLTGNKSPVYAYFCAVNTSSGNSYFSGTHNEMRFCFWSTSNVGAMFCSIERDLDTNGVATANGIHVVNIGPVSGGNSTTQSQFIPIFPTSSTPPAEAKLITNISKATTQVSSSGTGVGPVLAAYGYLRNPGSSMLVCSQGDFSAGGTYAVPLFGTHQYLALTTAIWHSTMCGNNTTAGILMKFE